MRGVSTRSRRAVAAALAVALALALGGCESDREDADEKATSTVQAFLNLCSEGEGVAAQELLTEPARAVFLAGDDVLQSCMLVLGLEPGTIGSPEALLQGEVTEVKAHGGFASALVLLPGGLERRVELERVIGHWRLANAPTVALPGRPPPRVTPGDDPSAPR